MASKQESSKVGAVELDNTRCKTFCTFLELFLRQGIFGSCKSHCSKSIPISSKALEIWPHLSDSQRCRSLNCQARHACRDTQSKLQQDGGKQSYRVYYKPIKLAQSSTLSGYNEIACQSTKQDDYAGDETRFVQSMCRRQ